MKAVKGFLVFAKYSTNLVGGTQTKEFIEIIMNKTVPLLTKLSHGVMNIIEENKEEMM